MAATLAHPRPATQGWRTLGLGGSGRLTTPAKVLLPDDLVATAAGSEFSLGETSTGQIWSWGPMISASSATRRPRTASPRLR